ncbi:hypothetical protein SERLADRAFT_474725 [Serpula lacrymans var. lacrymans S7.9]|uniref:Protein PBN1 n=1 Tax=Serpula lacrymans var. lacrymans (strain S7.9) TaxID=578457 RepID=F8P5C7_SERL9|nr:uncharacterized protein SERLADRAFT_474725 [Serpula lacrymans var. lacrymans S7.9]EGO21814.1 hypothetical protein SERLADRAFT_474725 [Serpula lacrymans var. lacrymans S7.9]
MKSIAISSYLAPIQGSHSTYSTRVHLWQTGAKHECTLHFLHMLPPDIIVDPYELIDLHHSFNIFGVSNLELPVSAVQDFGTVLLLNASLPNRNENDIDITIDIPIHIRYGVPSSHNSHKTIEVKPPASFWACPTGSSEYVYDFPDIPSELYSPLKRAWPHPVSFFSAESMSTDTISIPVGGLEDLFYVELGTVGVIIVAFLYLLQKSVVVARTLQSQHFHED